MHLRSHSWPPALTQVPLHIQMGAIVEHLRQLSPLGEQAVRGIWIEASQRTAVFNSLHGPDGDLVIAIADMDILCSHPSLTWCTRFHDEIANAKIVFVDGNLNADSLRFVCTTAHQGGARILFEPVSLAKCLSPIHAQVLELLDIITPNELELARMCHVLQETRSQSTEALNTTGIQAQCRALLGAGVRIVVVTRGAKGVLAAISAADPHAKPHGAALQSIPGVVILPQPTSVEHDGVVYVEVPAIPLSETELVNTLGAGDAFAAGLIYGMSRGLLLPGALQCGIYAAWHSVRTESTVSKVIKGFL
uniref:Carbohydrate kinase PfkB domain-containing protein n=1 Tax=Eutreptiella gymnastica TaxID=73025 RepID=A0A7S1J260_9EUGL|mmetsp:Transcript_61431/g.109460  ORF Transcript_61431/g.109460 Transcript_61431/m.109460 type:complete len:306 (+) Transcript_61431:15-932(+)